MDGEITLKRIKALNMNTRRKQQEIKIKKERKRHTAKTYNYTVIVIGKK